MRVLLANEWGWPGNEIETVLRSAANVELTEAKRWDIERARMDLAGYDAVITFGPHVGRLRPIFRRVAAARRASRTPFPKVIWWLNENLPDWDHRTRTRLYGRLRLLADRATWWFGPDTRKSLRRFESLGHRYRIQETVHWAHRRGLLDVLAVTSEHRRQQLAKLGIPALHAPMGWGPSDGLGRDLGLDRDIQVLWVGGLSCMRVRRDRLVHTLREELRQRGVEMTCFSGGLAGAQRTEVLNRTKVLVNLLRAEHDFTGHRLLLGAANKALNVSEPMVDHTPFVPGEHVVFAPLDQLADTIVHYLGHEDERRRIAEQAYELVHGELTMERAVQRVFDAAGLPLEQSVCAAPGG